MKHDNMLAISEHFYSLQGEGPNMGKPSVFLRLKHCNLLCGGGGTVFDKQLHDGATWRCDTIETWMKGTKLSIEELLVLFEMRGYIGNLRLGSHLIITGGEPMLQQHAIEEFLKRLRFNRFIESFTELETNCTVMPEISLDSSFHQINCSPKLKNSGVQKGKRYNEEVLERYANCLGSIWKFVIHKQEDWLEIEDDFLGCFPILKKNVYLMPASSNREELAKNSIICANLALEHGCNFSSRLQIEIWNQTTGV